MRSRYEAFIDKELKIVINCSDLCNDRILCQDDIELQIDKLDEINNSYESEYDRQDYITGPRLLLCRYCAKEYLIPAYPT